MFCVCLGLIGLALLVWGGVELALQPKIEKNGSEEREITSEEGIRYLNDSFRVMYNESVDAAKQRMAEHLTQVDIKTDIRRLSIKGLRTPHGKSADDMIALFRQSPSVKYAERNAVVTPLNSNQSPLLFSDPNYPDRQEKIMSLYNMEEAWEITKGSTSVIVAVSDDGVNVNHRDLQGHISSVQARGNNHERYHGTMVAGVIAQKGGNSEGGVGMMPGGVSILPVYAFGSADEVQANIDYAVRNGARVVNMSWGLVNTATRCPVGYDYSDPTSEAVFDDLYRNFNVVFVAATGNSGGSCGGDIVSWPARLNSIIAVGGTDASGGNGASGSDFPSRGVGIDIVTYPWYCTTTIEGGYDFVAGTSFSSPKVAGLAGLLLSKNPDLTSAQVRDYIQRGATDLDAPGYDTISGWGRMNAYESLRLMMEEMGIK